MVTLGRICLEITVSFLCAAVRRKILFNIYDPQENKSFKTVTATSTTKSLQRLIHRFQFYYLINITQVIISNWTSGTNIWSSSGPLLNLYRWLSVVCARGRLVNESPCKRRCKSVRLIFYVVYQFSTILKF